MPQPIVDYLQYRAFYSSDGFFKGPMAHFNKTALLTVDGKSVWKKLYEFMGKQPRFYGVNRKDVYLKYSLMDIGELTTLEIATDWLRDLGYEPTIDNRYGWTVLRIAHPGGPVKLKRLTKAEKAELERKERRRIAAKHRRMEKRAQQMNQLEHYLNT